MCVQSLLHIKQKIDTRRKCTKQDIQTNKDGHDHGIDLDVLVGKK